MNSIKELEIDTRYQNNSNLSKELTFFKNLIQEIKKKKISNFNPDYINSCITELNEFEGAEKEFKKLVRKNKQRIFRYLEKEFKITPKNYHRNRWIGIGMLIYGVSFGVLFSVISGNFAFLGIGLPIGMVVGMAIGNHQDKKAEDEGRQLDINLN